MAVTTSKLRNKIGKWEGERNLQDLLKRLAFMLLACSCGTLVAPSRLVASNYSLQPHKADQKLQLAISGLWKKFPGRTGIAILTPGAKTPIEKRGYELFPQQSISKLWVSLMVYDRVQAGKVNLHDKITVSRKDIVIFNQPLEQYLSKQLSFRMSIQDLLEHSITASDNMANNKLLFLLGGPASVRENLARRKFKNIRFGPGEVLLQSSIAGLKWRNEYKTGEAFKIARSKVDFERRKAALKSYLRDPVDGATPIAIVHALRRLNAPTDWAGRALIATMKRTFTGKRRLKSGIPERWTIAHKTGTGQVLGPVSTAINNVGVLSAPDGCQYYVAVMVADTTADSGAIHTMFGDVSRQIARHHKSLHSKKR